MLLRAKRATADLYFINVGKLFVRYLKSSWIATANFHELNIVNKDAVYPFLSWFSALAMLVMHVSVVSMGMMVALYIQCMNFLSQRNAWCVRQPSTGFFQRGFFQRIKNLAPKNTFHEILRKQLSLLPLKAAVHFILILLGWWSLSM